MTGHRLALAAVLLTLAAAALPAQEQDPIIRAMVDEIDRSKALRVVDLDKPYYIEYSIEDADSFAASASFGGLLSATRSRARIPQVQVRVGDYSFDNTNHIYSNYYSGARFDPEQWPLDNNYALLRQCFWLATDRSYKTGLEAIARKRAAIKGAANPEQLPDFSKTDPIKSLQSVKFAPYDEQSWVNRIRELSTIFNAYPDLQSSEVSALIFRGESYFANSEGTVERTPDTLLTVQARAASQAPDGMPLHDSTIATSIDMNGIPPDSELRKGILATALNIENLVKAPAGESYSGPVLFEPTAAAQLLAQVVGENLRVGRRPVTDPGGRPAPFSSSEFESKLNSRILPEWMDVVDDATQKEWQGHRLAGYYPFDLEGVPPKPVVAVEKGVLKSFLTTRQPVRGGMESNGHARLQAPYGGRAASIGNLFIKANESKPLAGLKSQLVRMCKDRNLPYVLLVRKLDFPTSASIPELQTMFAGLAQSGGRSKPVSPPVLVYRVYPDGREELIRGMRFRSLDVRSLRDIAAASAETAAFDFVNNSAPFAMIGGGGLLAPATVVAPALLFEDMELEPARDEFSKPPIVPAPPLETATR